MTKLLHEFRMDWVALVAAAKDLPTTDEQAKLIQRAKDFISNIQNMVLQETKGGATEFQNNMAQMEKDLKSQLGTTVASADRTDGFHFDVILESTAGKVADSVSNAKIWLDLACAECPKPPRTPGRKVPDV
jgi:hypothetical protein